MKLTIVLVIIWNGLKKPFNKVWKKWKSEMRNNWKPPNDLLKYERKLKC